jgi:hypothetical protein
MKNIIVSIVFITITHFNFLMAQDYINLMQNGRSHYERKNYLTAYERFNQAYQVAESDEKKKDADSWKATTLKFLQKQYKELGDASEQLKKTKDILDALYFYDNRVGLAFKNQKFGFINKEGVVLIPFIYDEANQFDPFSGYAKVSRNNTQYLIDTSGREYPLANSSVGINGSTIALDLRNQQLNTIPSQIFNCYNLKVLLMGNNQLTSIPVEISKLKNLEFLDLSNNKIGTLPEDIGKLANLKFLSLSGNQLGKLPEGISLLEKLEVLRLDNNNLFAIPKGFGNLNQLYYLNLEDNKLTSMPAEVCRLYSLRILMMQRNQIETIAPEIGNLRFVENICLSENNIMDLPPSMERMTALKSLNISKNKIGNIPMELKKLTSLKEFNLLGNRIPEDKKGMLKSWFPECNIEI